MKTTSRLAAVLFLSTFAYAALAAAPPHRIPFRRAYKEPVLKAFKHRFLGPRRLPPTAPPLPAGQLWQAALNLNIKALGAVVPPEPTGMERFLTDEVMADQYRIKLLQLGKALFWDQQLGGDGQSCASCHFHAGADSRSKNQLNPGFRNTIPAAGDMTFGNSPLKPRSHPAFGPNYQLSRADFPLHKLANPADAGSALLSDTNDVVSSQGSFAAGFTGLGVPYDAGAPSATTGLGPTFSVKGLQVRSVAPRNTPSVINSVFNQRNFWDSRARAEFNGVDPIGTLDAGAMVAENVVGSGMLHTVRIGDASTASQADGPPLSDVEMSYANRRFAELGRKMLGSTLVPLALQRVALDDSVLGSLSRQQYGPGVMGIDGSYASMVAQIFRPEWVDGGRWLIDLSGTTPKVVDSASARLGPNVFTFAEYNFSLFFGLAIREYESMLIADQTPFDNFMMTGQGLDPAQLHGLQVFLGKGDCVRCHGGPELTNAGTTIVALRGQLKDLNGFPPSPDLIERMVMGNGGVAVYDTGHYNIGVRPTSEDLGLGATIGPDSLPLSNARRFEGCLSKQLNGGASQAAASITCGVTRILARPFEAAQILRQASALLGDPPAVVAYLAAADGLLGPNDPLQFTDPSPMAASGQLEQARQLMLTMTGGRRPAVQKLLASAVLLLPYWPDPGSSDNGTDNPLAPPLQPNERVAADGTFKAPGLRNVALTAPFFHNGGQATLEQVVEFYNRGGDFAKQNIANLDTDVQPLLLTAGERADLVAFLGALTDERVRWESAPFDHPSLSIPNGGGAPRLATRTYFPGFPVLDDRFELPEVGVLGSASPLGTVRTAVANFPDPQR